MAASKGTHTLGAIMDKGDGRSYNSEFSWFEVESAKEDTSSDFAYKHSWLDASPLSPAPPTNEQSAGGPTLDSLKLPPINSELSEEQASAMSPYPHTSSHDADSSIEDYPNLEVPKTDTPFTYFEEVPAIHGPDDPSEPSNDAEHGSTEESYPIDKDEAEMQPLDEVQDNESSSPIATPQEVWNRLSRVAALGLKPGEALKPPPTLVQQNPSGPDTHPVVKDVQEHPRPIETYNAVQGLLEGLDDLKPNMDAETRLGSENAESKKAENEEAERDLENHPFFTTMELKNKVFEQTGQFDEQFDKTTTKLEKQGWNPKSDDLIVTAKRRWGLKKH